MKRFLSVMGGLLVGLTGGLASQAIVRGVHAAAADPVVPLRELRCIDAGHRLYAQITQNDRGSEFTLYDTQGHSRLRFGMHPDGSPFLGLYSGNDETHARALLRLSGPQQSGALVLKDARDRDRLVMGLNATDDQDPFFVYYDKDGASHALFGHS